MYLTDSVFIQLTGILDNLCQEIEALHNVQARFGRLNNYELTFCRSPRMATIFCGSWTPSALTRSMAPV
jgi:hypothetical protein